MKPLKLAIPAVFLLALAAGGVLLLPQAYRWYLDLRFPRSPKLAVGSTNWSKPAGTVARAAAGGPDWAATEPPLSRQDADGTLRNPVAASPESVAQGKILFGNYCAPCHGTEGRGDGPVAQRAAFPPPNLTVAAGRRSEGFLYATIRNGGAVMPSFGHALAPVERWAVVNFLKSISVAPPALAPDAVTAVQPDATAPVAPVPADAARGKQVFADACSTCHSADTDEEIVGPGLKNLFQWPAHRGADGSQHDRHTVPMIRRQIVEGGGAMAPMGGEVNGQALEDLLAYLRTL